MSQSTSTEFTAGSPARLSGRILVLIAVILASVTAFIGTGALGGTEIEEAAGGWLDADATPLAPDNGAFRIWSVIYVFLLGYSIWLLTPTARRSQRQHALVPWAVASAVLNAAWIWSIQLGSMSLSVVVILILVAVLFRILMKLRRIPPVNKVDAVVSDGTFGLYLGWTGLATVSNIAAWAASMGAEDFDGWIPVAMVVVMVIAALAVLLAAYTRGRIAPALTIAWGLAWVAVGRTEGEFESLPLTVTAASAAAVALIATGIFRLRRNKA